MPDGERPAHGTHGIDHGLIGGVVVVTRQLRLEVFYQGLQARRVIGNAHAASRGEELPGWHGQQIVINDNDDALDIAPGDAVLFDTTTQGFNCRGIKFDCQRPAFCRGLLGWAQCRRRGHIGNFPAVRLWLRKQALFDTLAKSEHGPKTEPGQRAVADTGAVDRKFGAGPDGAAQRQREADQIRDEQRFCRRFRHGSRVW